ncbi:unnamed protein product [Mytilus edulis]|uniref:Uncharacterized protein n=1 Tax=Mytilus edulis TaxID=6550 RepID=A0A8S3QAK0_MYTED|nr:unnamed protein product [Mytilus edulis]
MATLAFQQQCIKINSCSYDELRLLPGVGNVVADKIMSMRETLGNIQPEHLMEIPRLKITEALIDFIDFHRLFSNLSTLRSHNSVMSYKIMLTLVRQSKPENIHRTNKLGYTKPSIRLNVEGNIDSRDYSRHQATQHQNPQLGWQQGPNENIENRDYSRNHNPNPKTSQLGWQQGPNENIEKRDYSRNHNPHQQTSQVGWQQGPNEHKPRTERPVPVPRRHQRLESHTPSTIIHRRIPSPEIRRRIPSPENSTQNTFTRNIQGTSIFLENTKPSILFYNEQKYVYA